MIDKNKLLDQLEEYLNEQENLDKYGLIAEVITIVNEQPELPEREDEPDPAYMDDWIPAKREPIMHGRYLVTKKRKSGKPYVLIGQYDMAVQWGTDGVIAWQPLPNPYREDEE